MIRNCWFVFIFAIKSFSYSLVFFFYCGLSIMLLKCCAGCPAIRILKWELTNTYSIPAGWCRCIIFSARQTLTSLLRHAIHIPYTDRNACSVDLNFRFCCVGNWVTFSWQHCQAFSVFDLFAKGDHSRYINKTSQMHVKTD